MPNILKNFFKSDAYVFPDARELFVGDASEAEKPRGEEEELEKGAAGEEPDGAAEEAAPEPSPIDYAQIQAQAILEDARQEAELLKADARRAMAQEKQEALQQAREDGYRAGFDEGMAEGNRAAALQREKDAKEQIAAIQEFLEQATKARDKLLDDSREELKELALAIAEKVIRLSLRGSNDILLRMAENATDKHKRCEWVHIYLAGCDVQGQAQVAADMAHALRHLSSRVRVIPMSGDESGTCIIEMPDEILDASVSTQLGNIRDVLANTALDKEE